MPNKIHEFNMAFIKAKSNPIIRLGQAYMNALADVDIDLYNELTATDADPFYDDMKIPNFLEKVYERLQ